MRKCNNCPIKGTEQCHMINPMAPRYTRSEKERIAAEMAMGQSMYKEAAV